MISEVLLDFQELFSCFSPRHFQAQRRREIRVRISTQQQITSPDSEKSLSSEAGGGFPDGLAGGLDGFQRLGGMEAETQRRSEHILGHSHGLQYRGWEQASAGASRAGAARDLG
jgi:hypothetical protein